MMEIEKECTLLGNLFQSIVTDLKISSPVWDDFVSKGTKFHSLLKSTAIAAASFVESIQKIADGATNTKGSTKDIGSALTRICVRQKMIENKLKLFTNSLQEKLLCPVQERLEEWKKVTLQLEKDHSKDYKKAMQEIKKRNSETLKLQKKVRKGSKPDLHQQLSSSMLDVNDRFSSLVETERSALRNLLVEERTRICLFANCLAPTLEYQVSMLNEGTHLHELTNDITRLCRNPKQLPTSTEQLVTDFISTNSQTTSSAQNSQFDSNLELTQSYGVSPPSSPISSRKSSLCSLNSINSCDSRSSGSLNNTSSFRHHYQGYHRRTSSSGGNTNGHGSPTSCKSAPSGAPVARLSSVSSRDSGFVSEGNGVFALSLPPASGGEFIFKPPLPPPSEKQLLEHNSNASPAIRSQPNSEQLSDHMTSSKGQNKSFSWKDWSKPGPYDVAAPPQQLPSQNDSRRQVLPNKPQAPPPLSPKPDYLVHRSSIAEIPKQHKPSPLFHRNSEPCVYPAIPPKDVAPLPPPPSKSLTSPIPIQDEFPPPPPSFLADLGRSQQHPDVDNRSSSNSVNNFASLSSNTPPNQFIQSEFSSMTLNRKSSSNSLQYSTSSGYSSQYTTPACSEDTIASSDADLNSIETDEALLRDRTSDNDRYSTLPRNYHHNNTSAHAHNSQHRERYSSVSSTPTNSTTNNTGTATIRRKPSSKFNSIRRNGTIPKPVQTPTIPSNAASNLMSTFQQPNTNCNHNNNHVETSGDISMFGGYYGS